MYKHYLGGININRKRFYVALAAAIFTGSISLYAASKSPVVPAIHTSLSSLDSKLNYENFVLNNKEATSINVHTVDNSAKSILALNNSKDPAVPETQINPQEQEGKNLLKAGATNEDVKQLQTNLKKLGFFTGEITGYYGDITVSAVKNFQKSNSLPESGEANQETIDKLSYFISRPVYVASRGSSRDEASKAATTPATNTLPKAAQSTQASPVTVPPASKGKVTMLQWFGGAENVFSIGSVATITDLNTGLVFRVKRTYGYNHADCEALTAADTAIMKKAAGGSWNWTRRPVIVDVNGQRIAASMAPFPHAGRDDMPANITVDNRSGDYGTGDNLDTIKGNNMDGHFDIHFLGSKTHGSNEVDANHQATVKKAYEMSN